MTLYIIKYDLPTQKIIMIHHAKKKIKLHDIKYKKCINLHPFLKKCALVSELQWQKIK